MSDKWERTYAEIALEAGEGLIRDNAPWPRLFRVLRAKFEPIADLDDQDLDRLRTRMAIRQRQKVMLYLFDTAICSFCRRATFEARVSHYGRKSRACQACVLQGKCFDPDWVVRPMYRAITKGNFTAFRALLRKGLSDIAEILKDNDDGPSPT